MDELVYETKGAGPPLMLLHGTGSTWARSWGPAVDALAESRTLILPFLPGSGGSPLPSGPIELTVLARQLAAVADRAGHPRFAVAGVSLGAPIAVKIAALLPDRVTQLVTVAGFARPRPSLQLRFSLWESVLGLGSRANGLLLLSLAMPERAIDRMPAGALESRAETIGSAIEPGVREQLALAQSIDVEADLAAVKAPTLVLHGREDPFVDRAHGVHLAERIADARLLELDGGHGLPGEQTDAVVSMIERFTRIQR